VQETQDSLNLETPSLDTNNTSEKQPNSATYPIEKIYGVGARYAESFKRQGIETIGDIAAIQQIDQYEEPLGIPSKVLHKIRLRAQSYINGQVYQTETIEFPGDRLIYIDIETDERCSKIWLIGLLVDGHFTQLYADSWEDERQILEEFLSFLGTHRGYTLVSYSGTGFDYRVTLNAMKRLGIDPRPLEEFCHVDLCTVLRRSFIFPHHSYGLKELGVYLNYSFKQTNLDGLDIARAYQRHVDHGLPLEDGVLVYNEDDVRVVRHLFEKCFRLRKHLLGAEIHRMRDTWVYFVTRLDPWLK
jgi:predicted RecB family nuclease